MHPSDFRHHSDRERADRERRPDTPRNGPEPYDKYTRQGAQDGGPAAYLCNYLDHHGVKPMYDLDSPWSR
jgi:hypothetical protein